MPDRDPSSPTPTPVVAPKPPGPAPRIARVLLPVLAVLAVGTLLTRIPPPEPDAFYDPPAALPPGPPGTLIRQEPLEPAPPDARAWRILYRSTDPAGKPIAVSGTVYARSGASGPAGGRPVVAWAHPTTGVARRCAPSLGADGGAGAIPGLDALLAAGYVVTATDYPGLGTPGPHPYLVGESAGRAVLDSVRAARALTGAGGEAPAAVWGHAQGGHAALFAGQLAAGYAPDVRLVGVATAAPATDLTALLKHDIGGVTGNVMAAMAVVSWADVHATDGIGLDQVVEPEAVPIARRIAERCIVDGTQLLVHLPDAEVLRLRFLPTPPWNTRGWDTLLTGNTPGTTPAAVPTLINQGTDDTVVWRDVTTDWVADQCRRGGNVRLALYEGRSHHDIAADSADDTVEWLADRLAGQPSPSCEEARPGGI